MRAAVIRAPGGTPILEPFADPQPCPGLSVGTLVAAALDPLDLGSPRPGTRAASTALSLHDIRDRRLARRSNGTSRVRVRPRMTPPLTWIVRPSVQWPPRAGEQGDDRGVLSGTRAAQPARSSKAPAAG